MASCVLPNAQGFLAVVGDSLAECSGYVIVTADEYSILMDYTSITVADATYAIVSGFSLVFGLGFLSTYAVSLGKRLINAI